MFDNAPPPMPGQQLSGQPPGQPLRPFGSPPDSSTPQPASVSPERLTSIPPPTIPPTLPPMKGKGGGRKRTLLIVLLAVILLGGGAAVAAIVFPRGASDVNTTNTTNTTNALANANRNGNVNVNRTSNTNRQNTNITNSVTNTTNTVANVNTNTALPNTNTGANVNTAVVSNTNTTLANQNVNATTNTNTAQNVNTATNTNTTPASFSTDSDGDKLNDYLEQWIGTSKTNADSDNDGFPDGSEVVNKFSPLGSGQMTAAGFQTFCSQSTVVIQYGLPSADVSTLCGIGSDLLANVQVMAANANFFEDLDAQLSTSCSAFSRVDANVCAGLISFLMIDYLVSS